MAVWTITYQPPFGGAPITQDAATWGMRALKRTRKSTRVDMFSFTMPDLAVDAAGPFAVYTPSTMLGRQAPMLTLSRNGYRWFSGVITGNRASASGREESQDYQVSGPWFWLERTVFQQQWVSLDTSGGAAVTQTTTQSEVTLGQSLDGIKLNSGAVLAECLRYLQYAFQMVPFPTEVDQNHLPPQGNQGGGPFQIGQIAPSITVPYSDVRDKSCADIVRVLMKYSPDCVAWFDYSTTPPTLNITRRSGSAARAISVLGGNVAAGFNPRPRHDLQVPVVVCKFQSHDVSNGEDFSVTAVDSYPPPAAGFSLEVWRSQPGAWVQTIDLIGSQSTTQTVDLVVTARPTQLSDTVLLNWFLAKEKWLTEMKAGDGYSGSTPMWDSDNIGVAYIGTAIDPNDPLNTANPNNVPLPDCHTLVNELVSGTIDPWLQDDENLDAARVLITIWAKYTGNDGPTKTLFWFNPQNPTSPLSDGSGFLPRYYYVRVTNASTATYSEQTSYSAGEPVPMGMAQYLWTAMSQLHFEGTLTLVEDECSDLLPIGCVFNTTDGNPAWGAMNALVLAVDEDLDSGTTKVQFGPPLMLGLQELEELFRANLGRLPSYKLDQRKNGKTSTGSKVSSPRHAAETSPAHAPLGNGGGAPPWNWKVYNTTKGNTAQVQINGGDGFVAQLNGTPVNVNGASTSVATGMPPVYPQLAITGNGWVYAKVMLDPVSAAITALDAYFASSLPSPPTVPPYTFFIMPLAQISNYMPPSGSSSSPSFQVLNVYSGYGPSTLLNCLGRLSVY